MWDIREKMRGNKDLSIVCKKCAKAFIPHFAIHPLYYNGKFPKQRQQEYLNPSALMDVIEEMQKTAPGVPPDNAFFYQNCPVIFWNLLILFSDVRIELNHHADNEVHTYSIHGYVNKEEDSLLDSGSFSDTHDNNGNNRSHSKAEGKSKRRANFNISNFLNMHSKTARLSHQISRFDKPTGRKRFMSHMPANLSMATSIRPGLRPQKLITIDISRKALRATVAPPMAIRTGDETSLASVRLMPSIYGHGTEFQHRSDDSLAVPLQEIALLQVERELAGFSTARRRTPAAAIALDISKYNNLDHTQHKAGSKLIRNMIAARRTKKFPMAKEKPEDPRGYEKCIHKQLEDTADSRWANAGLSKCTRVARQFLFRAMELLLKKVSFAKDRELVALQGFTIRNQLLESPSHDK